MEWLFIHCFQVEWEFRKFGFHGGRKAREPHEKALEQGQEPTTNSTHIWRQLWDSNPRHTVVGGECSPSYPIFAPQIQKGQMENKFVGEILWAGLFYFLCLHAQSLALQKYKWWVKVCLF